MKKKKSNHLDFFRSPNLATKAWLIKERTQHESISNGQKDPNNNTGIKHGSLFSRKNMAGLMAGFLWKCTKSLHVPEQWIQHPMTKSLVLGRHTPSLAKPPPPYEKHEKNTQIECQGHFCCRGNHWNGRSGLLILTNSDTSVNVLLLTFVKTKPTINFSSDQTWPAS